MLHMGGSMKIKTRTTSHQLQVASELAFGLSYQQHARLDSTVNTDQLSVIDTTLRRLRMINGLLEGSKCSETLLIKASAAPAGHL